MKVLFLTLADINDINDRLIYSDLMKEFIHNGHNVTIISPRERKYKLPTQLIVNTDHRILKVRIGNTQKTNMFERGLTTILLQKQFLYAIKKYLKGEKFDLLLYSTPPVTFAKILGFLKKRDNSSTYLMLKDIFPQNGVDIELFTKKSLIYKYFRRKEKQLYSISDYIGCMSQANVDYLIKNNPEITHSKIEICPNSIMLKSNKALNKTELRKKFNLPIDDVVFVYGGNFGKPQSIEYIINILKTNEGKPNRHFVMCGTGTELHLMEKYLSQDNPKNVTLIKGLPKLEYDTLLSASDVGLIFLDRRYTIPNFPSRLLPYMEHYLPILAATDLNTDVGKVIVNGGFGWWCESKLVDDFNNIVDNICTSPEILSKKGDIARKFLENNYTVKHTYDVIMNHF